MSNSPRQIKTTDAYSDESLAVEWNNAIGAFKKRGVVLFFSYCKFWEQHGFVQQSLARVLVQNGVKVIWFDGSGWKRYQPVVEPTHSLLEVRQLFTLPGRRFALIRRASAWVQKMVLKRIFKAYPNAVVWVQAGVEEDLARALPRIDIYSTFDDPYYAEARRALCEKARLIFCQNSFSWNRLAPLTDDKARVALPPVNLPMALERARAERPASQSRRKRVGYIGSFFSPDFNLPLFESFIHRFPEWDFLLMGRTDEEGMRWVTRLQGLSNFTYHPWAPREKLGAAWNSLNLTLLLYHLQRTQDGAFPVKVLESLAFGVPCVATHVPKTDDLEGFVPRSSFPEKLFALAEKEIEKPREDVKRAFAHFQAHMRPENQILAAAPILEPELSLL